MAARGCYYPCYFAVGSVCRCPCGGANHNCGREGAPPRQAVVGGQMLAPAPVSVDLVPVETGGLADWDTEGPPASPGVAATSDQEEQDRFERDRQDSFDQDQQDRIDQDEQDRIDRDRQDSLDRGEQERFDAVLAAQRESTAASALAERAVTWRQEMIGTVNAVEQVGLDDGSTAYLKPVEQDDPYNTLPMYGVTAGEQATHEAAAYHLAEAMGDRYKELVATTAIVDDETHGASVLSAGRDGRTGMAWAVTPAGWAGEANRADVHNAAFFDAVCGNADRHGGNFLVTEDGRVGLIDHGFAFRSDGPVNQCVMQKQRVRTQGADLTDHERATLTRLSDSPNLLGVAGMIGGQRADAMRGRITDMLDSGLVPPR